MFRSIQPSSLVSIGRFSLNVGHQRRTSWVSMAFVLNSISEASSYLPISPVSDNWNANRIFDEYLAYIFKRNVFLKMCVKFCSPNQFFCDKDSVQCCLSFSIMWIMFKLLVRGSALHYKDLCGWYKFFKKLFR